MTRPASKRDPSVSPKTLGNMLVSSVRYALGRSTYIVGETCDWVRAYWPHIPEKQRGVILRDVDEEMQQPDPYRHDCDARAWNELLAFMRGAR